MKQRQGFVSNSSSSSFVIRLDDITAKQLKLIQTHQIKGKKHGIPHAMTDPWTIEVTEETVKGSTWMDNFDMRHYLWIIGIPENKIKWGELY